MQKLKKAKYLFLLLGFFLFPSCYEKEEGCLDINAINYDFEADQDCDDCCTYPTLKFKFEYFFGKVTYDQDSVFKIDNGEQIKILDFGFYISNIALSNEDVEFGIINNIEVKGKNGTVFERAEDIALIHPDQFSYTMGNVDQSGDLKNVKFDLGIDGNYISIMEEDSFHFPAYFNQSTYEYTNFKMDLEDVLNQDTITIKIPGSVNLVTYTEDLSTYISAGSNINLSLKVDLERLIQEISLQEINSQESLEKIKSRLSEFISLNL